MAAMRGWLWAVVAWFGSSLLAFAIGTASANRSASIGEEEERRLLLQPARREHRPERGGPINACAASPESAPSGDQSASS
jgi:hypothetical protein